MAEEEKQDLPAEQQSRPSGKDVPPSIKGNAFCCPHCGAYTHQFWYILQVVQKKEGNLPFVPGKEFLKQFDEIAGPVKAVRRKWEKVVEMHQTGKIFFEKDTSSYSDTEARNLHLSKCFTCNDIAVWVHDRLVYPPQRNGPAPNEDLPEPIKADYEEARSILNLSPRGAAALLRLCVEKLCIHLKAEGSTLDDKIADLVTKGLDVRVQRALDAVRVVGNEAVHPGQMDLNDDPDTAEMLFKLVNVIAEKTISEREHVDAIYALLPPSKRKAIERRDKSAERDESAN